MENEVIVFIVENEYIYEIYININSELCIGVTIYNYKRIYTKNMLMTRILNSNRYKKWDIRTKVHESSYDKVVKLPRDFLRLIRLKVTRLALSDSYYSNLYRELYNYRLRQLVEGVYEIM